MRMSFYGDEDIVNDDSTDRHQEGLLVFTLVSKLNDKH